MNCKKKNQLKTTSCNFLSRGILTSMDFPRLVLQSGIGESSEFEVVSFQRGQSAHPSANKLNKAKAKASLSLSVPSASSWGWADFMAVELCQAKTKKTQNSWAALQGGGSWSRGVEHVPPSRDQSLCSPRMPGSASESTGNEFQETSMPWIELARSKEARAAAECCKCKGSLHTNTTKSKDLEREGKRRKRKT